MTEDAKEDPSLPTVAGAIKTTLDSKLLVTLLKPSAEVFAAHFASRSKEIVDSWAKKRRSNLEHHVRTVEQEGVIFPELPSEVQAILTNQWAEEAQQVDPEEDPELAALWEAILSQIAAAPSKARQLIRIVKQLDPDDASLLLSLPKSFVDEVAMEPRFARLISLGLVEKLPKAEVIEDLRASNAMLMYSTSGLVLVGFTIVMRRELGGISEYLVSEFNKNPLAFVAMIVGGWLLMYGMSRVLWRMLHSYLWFLRVIVHRGPPPKSPSPKLVPRYVLTSIGSEIRDQGVKFRNRLRAEEIHQKPKP